MKEENFVEMNLNQKKKRYLNTENGCIYNRIRHGDYYFYDPLQIWIIDGVKCVYMRASSGKEEFLEYAPLVNDGAEVPRKPTKCKWAYTHRRVAPYYCFCNGQEV